MGYSSGDKSAVRRGMIKISKSNFNANALLGGVENPENEVILIDRIVLDIKTAAEATSTLVVGLDDNATDNVLDASVNFMSTNAENIGVAVGPDAAVNYNCKVAAANADHNATDSWILIGAGTIAGADSLVADAYIDYIIP